ncbi:MAG: N-acetyl-gamma-glutamyl-phosphate reductase [Gemmatimonadota bacterium]
MLRVSVAGAAGYTGGELVRWLLGHPGVELVHLAAGKSAGRRVAELWPSLRGLTDGLLVEAEPGPLAADSDVVFLALPTRPAIDLAARLMAAEVRVVDLGAGFRLRDPATFHRSYGGEHPAPGLLPEAVYGLTELHCTAIRDAHLVANPGCYPTATALALAPLVREGYAEGPIVVDAKSGLSGAGRHPSEKTAFGEVNESLRPYDVGTHRHQPEIEQTLSGLGAHGGVFFVPHLVPLTRGILASCYMRLARSLDGERALELYGDTYASSPFVRVTQELPRTKATLGSNFCDVTVRVDEERGLATAIAAIDNLGKGAAGQAVQNLNVMFGLPETEGLWTAPLYP